MTEQIPIFSVKGWRNFKFIIARLLFNLYEIPITSRIVENVCNIVLILIAPDQFSSVITSKVFCS